MATAKTEPTESIDTPKTNIITFAKGATAADKMAALKEAQKALETEVINELTVQKDALETQLAEVNKKIEAITGPPLRMEHPAARAKRSTSKAPKAEGIKVNASRLEELIKGSGGTLKLRGGKDDPAYDLETVRELVEESKGKLVLGGNKPWYTVSHAK